MEKNPSVQSSPYLNKPLRSIEEAKADLEKAATHNIGPRTSQADQAHQAPPRHKSFSSCKD